MQHDRDLRLRRIRFAAAPKPSHDTGALLIRSKSGKTQLARRGIGVAWDHAARIDMPYPKAPPNGLTAEHWTVPWPLARSRSAMRADALLAVFPTLALLLPYLLSAAPDDLIRTGLILSATCLFSASCLARQRLERDTSIRIHARFWDRIVGTPLPPADAENGTDNAMYRTHLLERGLEGALTLVVRSRNLIASITVLATAAIFIWHDSALRPLLAIHVPVALSVAFLLESGRHVLEDRLALARHEASRLERHVALSIPNLRQLGASLQKQRELAKQLLETARANHTFRLLRAVASTSPFWLSATCLATTLAVQPALNVNALSGLLLLTPAIWCAATSGRHLACIHNARRRIEALAPFGLARPSQASLEPPIHRIESVRLEGIDFRHDPAMPAILTAFSIAISRGEIIALTGPSGSGKSTVLDILMGLKAPQKGRIIINRSERDWQALSSYRAHIAGILQDTPIGLATIRGVIGQNAPMARETDILQAATDAGLARAVAALPMGMQSLVVEGGFPKSLGQQLLIARALAQQPDLLILDETFSTLDRQIVETIIAAVRRRGITLVFATHRADLTALADRTISLETPHLPAILSGTMQTEFAP